MTTFDRIAPVFYVRASQDGAGGSSTRIDPFDMRVLSFKYEDEESKADRVTFTLDNFDLSFFDDPAFKHGMLLDVSWGYPGRMSPTRQCVVQSIKGGKTLTVTALAKSILMAKKVRARTFTNVRYSDIARTLATENGYGPESIVIEDTSIVYDTVAQARLSDAQFLRRLADKIGFEFFVDHEGLHFHPRRVEQAPLKTLIYYIDQAGGDIVDFSIDNDLTKPRGRHRRQGRDALNRTEIDEEASNETDTNRPTLAPVNAVPAPRQTARRGAAVTFDRDTSAPTMSSVDDRAASEDVSCTSAQDAGTAAQEARGRNRKARQSAVQMKVTIVGDPYIVAKRVLLIEGMGVRLSGRYYIKRIVNTVGKSFTQELELISDGHSGHRRRSGIADLELPGEEQPNTGVRNVAAPTEPVVTFSRDTSAPSTQYRPRRGT